MGKVLKYSNLDYYKVMFYCCFFYKFYEQEEMNDTKIWNIIFSVLFYTLEKKL
jgi:hypothetical protein